MSTICSNVSEHELRQIWRQGKGGWSTATCLPPSLVSAAFVRALGPAGEHFRSGNPQQDKHCHWTSADHSHPNQFPVQARHPIMSGIWFDMYLAVKAKRSPLPLPLLTPVASYVRMWHLRGQLYLQAHRAGERWAMTTEALVPDPSLAPEPASCLDGGAGTHWLRVREAGTPLLESFPCLSTFHRKPWTTQCESGYQIAFSLAGRTQGCKSIDMRSPKTRQFTVLPRMAPRGKAGRRHEQTGTEREADWAFSTDHSWIRCFI